MHEGRLRRSAVLGSLRKRVRRCAAWYPRQISTENVDCKRRGHEDCSYPESPVTMHTPPIWPWIGFSGSAAVSFGVVLASGHSISISDKYSPLRAASLQCARRKEPETQNL